MADGELDEQERAILRQVGAVPTNRKPISVWIAQALCLLFGACTAFFAWRLDGASSVVLGLLGLIYFALLVGLQMRHSWSRWTLVVLLALTAGGSILQALQGPAEETVQRPGRLQVAANERSGAAAGRVTVILLMLVLGWRLGFGDPAKRYFANPARKAE